MSDAQFPVKGQHFGVMFATAADRSYRDDIFVCLASDQHRVVGKAITPHWNREPMVFHREDWSFQTVDDSLVEAMHFPEEQAQDKQAA